MRIVAEIPVHYGKEYLKQAVEAVSPVVDRIVVLYASQPSFGRGIAPGNPDSEAELMACCDEVKSKLTWHRGKWGNEGSQRNTIFQIEPEADLIVRCDSDEIWDVDSLSRCVRQAMDGTARNYLIEGFIHYWRSFKRACVDVWRPVRIIKTSGRGDDSLQGVIHHMGYAQSAETVAYKMLIHGHKSELRPRWFEEIFMDAGREIDLHPVVKDWWNATPVSPMTLPDCLLNHPNFNKDTI